MPKAKTTYKVLGGKRYLVCVECECPVLRKGQKRKNPDDYRHANGCPLDDYVKPKAI